MLGAMLKSTSSSTPVTTKRLRSFSDRVGCNSCKRTAMEMRRPITHTSAALAGHSVAAACKHRLPSSKRPRLSCRAVADAATTGAVDSHISATVCLSPCAHKRVGETGPLPTPVVASGLLEKRHPRLCEKRLQRLHEALSQMTAEARRHALATALTEGQRLQLEQYLLRVRSRGKGKTSSAARLKVEAADHARSDVRHRPERTRLSKHTGILGIKGRKRVGGTSFSVTVSAGPFVLCTKNVRELAKAKRFHSALHGVAKRLSNAADSQEADVAQLLKVALSEELAKSGLLAEDLGLTFQGSVFAKYWIGQALLTPRFEVATAFEAGVAAWRRLQEARGMVFCGRTNRHTSLNHRHSAAQLQEAWESLLEAYTEVWTARGHDRAVVRRKLQVLRERHVRRLRAAAAGHHGPRCVRGSTVSVAKEA
eukprot:TRINITY_DN57810_c0_g1_i1.p1 TRINITY_DN57810_c0_g1~~TRINITY_DN57810_c0_g1_i1.p1  ORF type:complete len:424 (-),score=52.63 TRINITY_DN57810_c0_g1_i1:300-1571(-)